MNGLRACRKKPLIFVGENFPDFLCLQEVKLNQEVIPKDDFGYAFKHYHLLVKKGIQVRRYFPRKNPCE